MKKIELISSKAKVLSAKEQRVIVGKGGSEDKQTACGYLPPPPKIIEKPSKDFFL